MNTWYKRNRKAVVAVVGAATGVVVATSGFHTLRVTCTGRNVSSSAYVLRLVSLSYLRTA